MFPPPQILPSTLPQAPSPRWKCSWETAVPDSHHSLPTPQPTPYFIPTRPQTPHTKVSTKRGTLFMSRAFNSSRDRVSKSPSRAAYWW